MRCTFAQWEYERMTKQWWERLLYEVSEAGNIEPLSRLHPISPGKRASSQYIILSVCLCPFFCLPLSLSLPRLTATLMGSVRQRKRFLGQQGISVYRVKGS